MPFKGEWFVLWGGDTKDLNQHHNNLAQKYAFDFVKVNRKGRTYHKSSKHNKNYYCFGTEIISPARGTVVQVVDGVDDNVPGYRNGYWLIGNAVIIKHSEKLHSLLAHFKQNTIAVKPGDKVKSGDFLGLCGNSGNSTEPH
ncbi:MAG: M23 family metallopeptidase, partial [Nitrososphaera sp.]